MLNKIKEFYILNIYYKYPIFQKKLYFIFKIDHSYYRFPVFRGLNIKKQITTNMVKQILREYINCKIYLFSRLEDENNEGLDTFVRLHLIDGANNYSLRKVILRNGL